MYNHRIAPEAVNGLYVSGRIKLYKIKYHSPTVIVPLRDMFWRQIGGHLRKVESSKHGVVWGIGYDNTARVYTNGWGGSFLKGLNSSSTGINSMTDTHNYYIYENQRWNPLSGYTAHGLPTDRNMWSDASGKQKRSKDSSKLLSAHWQWVSNILIVFEIDFEQLKKKKYFIFYFRFPIGLLIFTHLVASIVMDGNMLLIFQLHTMQKKISPIMFVVVVGIVNVDYQLVVHGTKLAIQK